MKYAEIIAIVERLNEGTPPGDAPPWSFTTDGMVSSVALFGDVVWDDENDERAWFNDGNDREPLEAFLVGRARERTDELTAMLAALTRALATAPPTAGEE